MTKDKPVCPGNVCTMKARCEYIAQYIEDTKGEKVSPESIFSASSSGELWHLFPLYDQARQYYGELTEEIVCTSPIATEIDP